MLNINKQFVPKLMGQAEDFITAIQGTQFSAENPLRFGDTLRPSCFARNPKGGFHTRTQTKRFKKTL